MPKISSSLWGYRAWTREKSLEEIGRIGYRAVEIVMHGLGTDVGYHLNQNELPLSDEKLDQLKKELGANNLQVSCLSPSTDFLMPSPPQPNDFNIMKNVIDLAVSLGKPLVRPFPCASKPTFMTIDEAIDIIVRGLNKCSEYAESCGVKLAVDITHSRVTNNVRNAVKIIDEVDSEYCGINIHTSGKSSVLLAEAFVYNGWNDKILHTHLVDSQRVLGERFGKPVPLGEGDNHIEEFVTVLGDARYSGWYNYEGPKENAKTSFESLTNMLEKLRIP